MPMTPASAKLAYANSSDETCTPNHGLCSTAARSSTPGLNAGIACSATSSGRMNTPIARSSVVISVYRYASASSHTNVEMDDVAPRAVAARIARRVAECVLARELVGDLVVHGDQLADLAGEERASARFLRELAEHELRLLEAFRGRRRTFARAQPDGVDGRF